MRASAPPPRLEHAKFPPPLLFRRAAMELQKIIFGLFLSTHAIVVRGLSITTLVPSWDIQSSAKVSKDLASLSLPGVETSSWYHVPTSRCTLMGCLLAIGVYNETELWYSDTLDHFNGSQFLVPWLYRQETAHQGGGR